MTGLGASADRIGPILRMLGKTQIEEYSCDDAHQLLDIYADMVSRGEDATAVHPLVKLHLELCESCREEFEAILLAITDTDDLLPTGQK